MELFILFFACIINLALGLFILLQNKFRASYTHPFVAMSVSVCVWVISNYLSDHNSANLVMGNLANKLAYISGYFTIFCILIFTYFFPVTKNAQKKEIALTSFFSIVIVALSFSNLIPGQLILDQGKQQHIVGSLLWLYVIGCFVLIFFIVRNLFRLSLRSNEDHYIRTQARIILVAFCFVVFGILFMNVISPIFFHFWRYVQYEPLLTTIFLGTVVYAVVHYALFDIRFAAIRTVMYIFFFGGATALYFFAAYIISRYVFGESSNTFSSRGPADIALVILIAFSLRPIKLFFDRVTSKLFFKDNYSSSEFFSRLNRIITVTTDLHSLLVKSANEIATTLKIEQVFFLVIKRNGRVITAGTNGHSKILHEDIEKIDEYIYMHGSAPIVKTLLNREEGDALMDKLMLKHKTEIIVPLLLSSQRIGYLCIGDKKSSNFNTRDVNIMESTADELTIAIQNMLAIQEIREFNENLQKRVLNATRELRSRNTMLRHLDKAKDEFVSMASHQLRTPLTSIKGYLSMVLEGDAGKISESQKQLLNEAFISSERMVHLINDFLNVSRIQTGKFIIDKSPVDLSKVVKQEIESLQSSAIARDLRYELKIPKNFPMINADEGKLRQVIMNFADNALYYSHENTVIEVELYVDGGDVVYLVKDTGIGVPKKEQAQLFTKFFRATNARIQRPDGTGVGLYMAKRIINSHCGKIIFKSTEGKGSTFGFRLPIK